jgi:hypothetical protein
MGSNGSRCLQAVFHLPAAADGFLHAAPCYREAGVNLAYELPGAKTDFIGENALGQAG